jgi:hypothetical protein
MFVSSIEARPSAAVPHLPGADDDPLPATIGVSFGGEFSVGRRCSVNTIH